MVGLNGRFSQEKLITRGYHIKMHVGIYSINHTQRSRKGVNCRFIMFSESRQFLNGSQNQKQG